MASRAALGIVPHTGWAWVVAVAADRVTARDRVIALPVLEAELYHHARDHVGDRAALFARERAHALDATIAATREVCAGAAVAVVLGKRPALPALEAIVASHARIHGAEGELWRRLFAEACARHRLAVARAERANARDARWLAAQGKALGSPWTQEIHEAALAARRAEVS
jgi:hypothetical protein